MLRKLAWLVVVFILCGCFPKYTVVTPELHARMMADLKAGKPTLTCEIECVYSWLNSFQRMITLHNASQWEALAELVMQVGHGKDISYYFLGKAAEGLGYYDAAGKYYRLSLELANGPNKFYHCRNVHPGNYCGGLDLPSALPKLIASVQAPGKTVGQAARDVAGQPRGTAAVGNGSSGFQFSVQKTVDQVGRDSFDLEVRHGGRVVLEGQSVVLDPGPRFLENTPASGCQTTVAETYSGGAHCCSTGIIAITCGPANHLYSIYYGNGGGGPGILEDVDGDGVKELALSDERFVYYNADARHFLPYSSSIKLTRYAVWTSQGWRVTGPGELKKAYLKLKNQALSERVDGHPEVATAIGVTYYALLSGEDGGRARKQLESLLPQDWKAISNKVFSDIQASISRSPIDPDSKESVITTIIKTSALNMKDGPIVIAFS